MSLFSSYDRTKNAKDRLWDMLGAHATFMLVTKTDADEATPIRARPMAGYPNRQEHKIWFLAHRAGLKDDEIAKSPQVCVTYCDLSKQHYASLSGRARIHDSATQRKKELWSVAAQAWFPEGPDDPDVLLLSVDLESAEFWDGDANPIVVGLKMARAAASGQSMEGGENAKLSFGSH
jgi:general stress protein 26